MCYNIYITYSKNYYFITPISFKIDQNKMKSKIQNVISINHNTTENSIFPSKFKSFTNVFPYVNICFRLMFLFETLA
jgi:hypothetical protein